MLAYNLVNFDTLEIIHFHASIFEAKAQQGIKAILSSLTIGSGFLCTIGTLEKSSAGNLFGVVVCED